MKWKFYHAVVVYHIIWLKPSIVDLFFASLNVDTYYISQEKKKKLLSFAWKGKLDSEN